MEEISVSIIIPSYGLNNIKQVIKNIEKQNYENKEIILINDNPNYIPNKETLNYLKKKNVKIITNPKNLGISGSLNAGILASKKDVISILCKDYFPKSKNWIKGIVSKLYSDKRIACVLTDITVPMKVWRGYDLLTKLFTFRHMFGRHPGGGNYKRCNFSKIGLFNERQFKFAGEDCDMHNKIKEHNYLIGYVDYKVEHLHAEKRWDIINLVKKEFRYGIGHGALKRKYGILKRIGTLDFEIRLALIALFIVGFFTYPLLSLLSLLVFLSSTTVQAIKSFRATKWIPGLILYPVFGLIIILIQTIGAVIGFLNYNE